MERREVGYKMIDLANERVIVFVARKDMVSGHVEQLPSQNRSLVSALCLLVQSDLGLGGKVLSFVEGEKIVVETRIFVMADTTTYQGGKKSIEILGKAAVYYAQVMELTAERNKNGLIDNLEKITQGNPGLVSAFLPIMLSMNGKVHIKIILIALGITAAEDVEIACNQEEKNLVPLLELKLEYPEMSLKDISAKL